MSDSPMDSNQSKSDAEASVPISERRQGDEDVLFKVLTQVGLALHVSVDRADVRGRDDAAETDLSRPGAQAIAGLNLSASNAGIATTVLTEDDTQDITEFLRNGFPVVLLSPNEQWTVLTEGSGRRFEACTIGEQTRIRKLTARQVHRLIRPKNTIAAILCRRELSCDSITSGGHSHDHHDHHEHMKPLKRFLMLIALDRRDVWTVVLFAFVAGILGLATPLAIESLVNVVSWGIFIQPLIVLGLILLVCLGLSGVLKVLQTIVVEIMQRRQFVRIVGDLAHRFPRVNQHALEGEYPRELANRVFDIMTIQKAIAVLLLDGVSIVLTTMIGMILLAFYHPFLLGFDIILLISMVFITWMLGFGGIRTAIDESITKYRVAHWLQDVLAMPSVFKVGGGESLAITKANQLTADYLQARKSQFRVVIRQVIFAIGLQTIASTALLGLGGWLVIIGQLTLGQLVASELVVTTVVGAFAKGGKSLEKFYDLMAGIDKVGHLIDLPVDPRQDFGVVDNRPAEVKWSQLSFGFVTPKVNIEKQSIQAGSHVALLGDDTNARALLTRALAGLCSPTSGLIQIAGIDASVAAANSHGELIAYSGRGDVFHGTLQENIDLGRSGSARARIQQALKTAGLSDDVVRLRDGLQTQLQTDGYPLTHIQARQLTLARAVVTLPKVLIVDGVLDYLAEEKRSEIMQNLTAKDCPWTLIVNTQCADVAAWCDQKIYLRLTS
ncbi:ATP-binding cassette domain-containing protein [Stieleria varia]|uniref:Toxin RTX-I translocation ATP-binding protein n=1 Tax=Stieleria varia TaxID=2528005 RepID=A0A5C6ATN1_9BACT|nr:ABC transporter ATP-binding protein [Stieleria varia]TWU02426.1 Toxin RTX-I translocation ATP-binding protein [Stieleria varia]